MTDASTTSPAPDTLTSLFGEAWSWLWDMFSVFPEQDEIATTGLTRRVALLLLNWLWSIEGMLRRIVIAAAVRSGPCLPASKPHAAHAGSKQTRSPRLPAFRILSVRGGGMAAKTPPAEEGDRRQESANRALRHAAFACDPLLLLGEARKGGAGPRFVRAGRSTRAMRVSRWHPLYTGPDNSESMRSFFGPFRDQSESLHPPRPQPGPSQGTAETRIGHHIVSAFDRDAWLRAEAEERVLYPAPGLARRIAALRRFAEDPNAAILRLAQRLRRNPRLAGLLGGAVWMRVRKAKSDTTPPPPAQDSLGRICHFLGSRLSPPDTS
jgi:hypothetical protein